jgi:hypothetical protein
MLEKISFEKKKIGHIFRTEVNFGTTKVTLANSFDKTFVVRTSRKSTQPFLINQYNKSEICQFFQILSLQTGSDGLSN